MKEINWKRVGDVYLLFSDSEELIRLRYHLTTPSVFEINGVSYYVERRGFWTQRFRVTSNGNEIAASTNNFWGTVGELKFSDGTIYKSDFKYRNVLTLRFLEGETEILHYDVGGEAGKQYAVLTLGIAMVNAEKLLIMVALGMVMFLSIFNEFNDGDDGSMILMVSASG